MKKKRNYFVDSINFLIDFKHHVFVQVTFVCHVKLFILS